MITRAALAALMLLASVALAGPGTYGGGGGGSKAKPGMVLPDTIYVATDRQMNIYAAHLPTLTPQAQSGWTSVTGDTDNAVIVPGSSPFVFDFQSTAGTMFNRSYRWTPAAAKDSLLTVTAYDYGGKRLESASTVLKAIAKTSGSGVKKVLFVGDSMFDGSAEYVISQVDSLFSVNHGAGGDIMPIGTKSGAGSWGGTYYHEATAGKGWSYFVTNPSGPFYKGGRLDFQKYLKDNSIFGPIDMVCVNLGGNNAFGFATNFDRAMSAADVDTAVIAHAKAFVDSLQNTTYGFPNAHIVFNIMPAPAALWSAYGDDYGGANNGAYVNYQKSMRLIAKAMIDAFDGGAYDRHADVCYGGLWVDNVLGYANATLTTPSPRITSDEFVGTNFLHPQESGMNQLADGIYSHLVYAHTLNAGTNSLVNSYNFTTPTGWTNIDAYYTSTGGQADPWGLNHATLWECPATPTMGVLATATNVTNAGATTATVSMFVKNVTLGATETCRVMLRNTVNNNMAYASFDFTTNVATLGGEIDVTGGAIPLGGGWYQVWVSADLTAGPTAAFNANVYPFHANCDQTDQVIIAGVQLEWNKTAPSGIYVEKP